MPKRSDQVQYFGRRDFLGGTVVLGALRGVYVSSAAAPGQTAAGVGDPLTLTKSEDLNRPFCLAGRRCVVIGFQDGTFPDLGRHRFGEMGGVWTHPLKIADGFWIGIEPDDAGRRSYFPHMRNWLTRCDEFVLGDGGSWVEHRYKQHYDEMTTRLENPPAPPSDEPADLLIIRRQFTPKEEPALGVEVTLESLTGVDRALELSILVRFDMLANFFSGWPDPLRLEAETGDGMVYVHSVRAENLPFTGGRWTAVLASDLPADRVVTGEDLWGPEKTQGRGISVEG